MRVARFSSRLAVAIPLVVTLLGSPGTSRADERERSPSDSTGASLGAETDSLFTIYPVKGAWIEARLVEPWGPDMVRYRAVSGETGYLAANKIRTIEDAEGNEREGEVLEGRKQLGTARPDERRSLTGWLFKPARSAPDRARRDYFLTEFGFADRVGGGDRDLAADHVAQTGLGWMKNLSPNWALGGVLQFASNVDDYHSGGIGLRVRRYLSDYWSAEGTVGAFAAGYPTDARARGVPLFGEIGVTAVGSITIFARFERHRYTVRRYVSYFPSIALGDAERSEDVMRIGLRLGPRPRALAIPAAILGTLVVMSPAGTRSLR